MRVLFTCLLVIIAMIVIFRTDRKEVSESEVASPATGETEDTSPRDISSNIDNASPDQAPIEYAPIYFDNARGQQPWSGKADADLNAHDAILILTFCEGEGRRQGWNAENRGDADTDNRNPFSATFLRGNPSRWWVESFAIGRQMFKNKDATWFE